MMNRARRRAMTSPLFLEGAVTRLRTSFSESVANLLVKAGLTPREARLVHSMIARFVVGLAYCEAKLHTQRNANEPLGSRADLYRYLESSVYMLLDVVEMKLKASRSAIADTDEVTRYNQY